MKYTAALIGTGRIGFTLGFDKKREQPASHTMALLDNKSINLIAAADTNQENLQKWQKYVNKNSHQSKPAQIFNSSDELYKNVKDLDIITVAVNEESHMAECIKAIEYKPKLVILEKPVALNSEEAKKIAECAAKNGVPVMVNHERRFAKDYLAVRNLMDQIGDIQTVTAELDSGLRVYGKEFEKDGTYSLLHDGTHLVDIVQFLLNDELKNPTVIGIYKDEKNIVRNFTAHYSTEKIPEITIKMSGRSKFFEFRIEILGTLGKIIVGNGIHEFYLRKESKLYTGFYSLTPQKLKLPKKTGYFSGMVQNAVDFLEGKSELVSPLKDAIKDLQVLEEIKAKF
ncbi:MAG: Gfo/Idh/MocA family oxidoreductase [Treponema sp.]|nr:Gfo/Idh/MocA family oxidoreductase [Candidatus Treponema equifaecale]